ncbi:type IV pilus modification protein PilV [Herminiimonas sp. KBW02]|uniref:type IV pilus modification protein PilV n=1 Tax=Herminiimonas sp. KBW02 TaxID=2153363 RepID=UPI000F5B2956|nr:type IV pilus modification protein PilV [Herminiimonas sp. KBW02]RQO33543.1 type IV pilus modification protein PilV [Herminiimonas sp. KBW02]
MLFVSRRTEMKTSAADGFSLIEVLISIFVLTVGVIGAASMQLTALQTSRWSAFQTTALHLALEMADHIRSHSRQIQSGDMSNPYLAIDYQIPYHHPAINCYGREVNCDAGELAQFEIALWLKRVSKELPAARVRVCRDMQPWDAGRRRYTWNCTESSGANSNPLIFIKIGWPEQNAADSDFPPVLVLPVALR